MIVKSMEDVALVEVTNLTEEVEPEETTPEVWVQEVSAQ